MPERRSFEYATVRVVPRVERGECFNAGVIVWCRSLMWLGARVALDHARLSALAPDADVATIHAHLASIEKIAAGGEGSGPIGALDAPERFRWLVAPRSTVIQVSEVHEGLCEDPAKALAHLFEQLVLPGSGNPGREP
ncbi:MAG: DUF3037 domain-containing protein [Candidatus Eisenbacteria bacterium]|nr:DUF3037 domain-containing protein [Candidatus Eisenbacteria bacterium]